MRERERPFTEEEVRGLMTQLLQGLVHMHRSEYFHRDLKPGIQIYTWDFFFNLFQIVNYNIIIC